MSRAKKVRTRFTVEGCGEFPFDMLRYDACWPETEARDSYQLGFDWRAKQDGIDPRRRVTLLTDQWHSPTEGRWKSFGWLVMSKETVR